MSSSVAEFLVVLGVSASIVVGACSYAAQAKDYCVKIVRAYVAQIEKVAGE